MSQPTILILGANGQLGNECLDASSREPQWNIIGLGREELDLGNLEMIAEILDDYKPDIVVNCAAYTAVDKAETEEKLANVINGHAVGAIADWTNDNDALLIQISTDYVFDGKATIPYNETHPTNPISVYGKSKLLGEKRAVAKDKDAVILRTAWVYSEYGHNFVKTMLRLAGKKTSLKIVNDQIGSPTYAHDLAEGIFQVIRSYWSGDSSKDSVAGIYNFTNSGTTSWHGLASKIFEYSDIDIQTEAIPTIMFPTPAARPSYSVLNTEKFSTKFKMEIPNWEDALRRCLRNMQL